MPASYLLVATVAGHGREYSEVPTGPLSLCTHGISFGLHVRRGVGLLMRLPQIPARRQSQIYQVHQVSQPQ